MSNLVNITLHGDLGETLGKEWKLAVSSVGEAIRAIETLTRKKLYKYLLKKDKEGVKYGILINGREFLCNETPRLENPNSIIDSELLMNVREFKTLDIIPIIEGANSNTMAIINIVLGVILIIVGLILIFGLGWTGAGAAFGVALIIAGVGLAAAGVIGLLTKPPTFEDFRNIEQGGKTSYLFSGPQNTTREGGPCFIGYGRLIVGSHVIAASYDITDKKVDDETLGRLTV